MTSDEVKLKAKEYCDRYRNHSIDSLIYAIRPEPQSFAENIYVDAYTQGRADALKELAQEVEGRSEFKQYKKGFSEGSERMAVNILESIKLWVQDNKDHSLIVGAQHLANFVELIYGRKLHKAVKLPGGEND